MLYNFRQNNKNYEKAKYNFVGDVLPIQEENSNNYIV
jgi:hypothetical protein